MKRFQTLKSPSIVPPRTPLKILCRTLRHNERVLNGCFFPPVSQEPLSDELFLEEPFGDETKPYFKHILLPNPDCLPFFIKTCILFHRKSLCIRLKHARETFSRSKPRKTHFQLHRHTHTHSSKHSTTFQHDPKKARNPKAKEVM